MKIQAIIHTAEEGGYWAEVPALPGCASQGETLEELTINLKEAIEGWLYSPNINLVGNDKLVEIAI
jgi:predicted RNase H-like HicB family nuclease